MLEELDGDVIVVHALGPVEDGEQRGAFGDPIAPYLASPVLPVATAVVGIARGQCDLIVEELVELDVVHVGERAANSARPRWTFFVSKKWTRRWAISAIASVSRSAGASKCSMRPAME